MNLKKNSSLELIRNIAPITEKDSVTIIKGIKLFILTERKVFLNPNKEPKQPGSKTAALEVFAKTGGMPVNKRAGKVIKLPPPAKEFNPPAKNAAEHTNNRSWYSTQNL